jgi:hypothetical protein
MMALNDAGIIDLFKWAPSKDERWAADLKTWIQGRLTERQRLAEEKRRKEEAGKGADKSTQYNGITSRSEVSRKFEERSIKTCSGYAFVEVEEHVR